MRLFNRMFIATACVLFATAASAENWPSRLIKATIPFGAGSAADVVPRLVFERLSAELGQPIVIENRVGAGVEWRILPRTYLSLAGSVERGDEVFYRATTSGSGGNGMARMRQSFEGQEPYSAPATIRAIGPALELGLDATFHLLASLEARHVASETSTFDTVSFFLGLGARL